MEDQLANRVFELIKNKIHSSKVFVKKEELKLSKKTTHGFHQWVDGNRCIGGFLIWNGQEELWFVFFEEYGDENFYLWILDAKRKNVLAEFHKTEKIGSAVEIKWKYAPTKRDGNNEARKELFTGQYGSTNVSIALPNNETTLDDFLNDVFNVIDCRRNSDNLIP